ncbi:MAG: hypothetical protein LQ340_005921 [Diploschistes diacapsis]|nr:MAG: hypothetical protein LQ340_005921 [Diploschistes diacapsis]
MSNNEKEEQTKRIEDDNDDEPDEWDQRICSTGCAGKRMMHEARYYNLTDMLDEQTRMNDCYFEKKDWRACSKEMLAFKECWKSKGNDDRTETKDA